MVKLVGILNVTPDSFSDGGKHFAPEAAIRHARHLFDDGAALVDIGAESTRPNAVALTPAEEWRRLEPVISVLLVAFPGRFTLDSYHPETIRRALAIGPVIINDVTGMNNPEMVKVAAESKAGVIISHLPGADIQGAHHGELIDDINIIRNDLLAKAHLLMDRGLTESQIIVDPGIGFGKTMKLNRELLTFAALMPEFEVMIGYSRKRFLGDHRMDLGPNIAAAKVAVASGAAYLRVHDVAGHARILL